MQGPGFKPWPPQKKNTINYTKNVSINLLIHNSVFVFNTNKSGGMIFIVFKGCVYVFMTVIDS